MKKNLLIIFTLIAFSFLNFNCIKENRVPNKKLVILTSIPPIANIIKKIGGDKLEVNTLITSKICLESYELKIADIKRISKSNLYVKISDSFLFEKEILNKLNDELQNVEIIDCSENIKIENENPHIWLSITKIRDIVLNINNSLAIFDSGNKDFYEKNSEKFLNELKDLDVKFLKKFENYESKKVITAHPFWYYFFKDYGINEIAIEDEGKEPTIKHIKSIVEVIKREKLNTIYNQIGNYNPQIISISKETGAKIVELDPFPEDIIANFNLLLQIL